MNDLPPNLNATAAAMISTDLRRQIKRMYEVDGVTIEELSQIFEIPELVIQSVVQPPAARPNSTIESLTNPLPVQTNPNGSDLTTEFEEQLARVRGIEDQLRDSESDAIQALGDLVNASDSDAIRMHSAKTILEIRAGKLRPERPVKHQSTGMTPDGFRTIVEETMRVYRETQERLAKATVTV